VFTGDEKCKLEGLISDYLTNKTELSYHEKIMRNCLKFIKEAPVFTLVYSTLEENTLNDYISLGASIEHICLSAKDIGVGSLWLGVILEFEEIIAKNYNVDNMKLISAVILGYPDEEPASRPRKDISEIVEYI
jgi:nitroreductase